MIPNSMGVSINNYEIQPSLTYNLDLENKRIIGKIDNKEAVMQSIKKILNTDKYAWDIYDWNYGHELLNLVGKEFDYIEVRLPQIIEEALLQDDRIKEISDFSIEKSSLNSLVATFKITTIFSTIDYTLEVTEL